ncbi:MAG: flagellar biosynthesis protein FlhF [Nitrospiraceae bacterium]|nr:flagellar biosynthesis protein FlhF [Nitrospiraceae bacterium]
MKIRKFKAKNFAEALEMVRRELSEDAVILSSEEKNGGMKPFVEVTAAVDYDFDRMTAGDGDAGGRDAAVGHTRAEDCPAEGRRALNALSARFRQEITEELKLEIDGLKAVIRDMKYAGPDVPSDRRKKALLQILRERKIREEFAVRLCEKARDENDLLPLIVSDLKAKRPPLSGGESKKAFMLIGPTGVGKTTTIAKLSARAIRRGERAAIINLDTYRIGAGEQVRIYSRIMGVPLATAAGPAEFRRHLANFYRTRDVIFIDTTGRNPGDASYIEHIRTMHEAAAAELAPPEIHLLMSASSDDDFMTRAYSNYRRLPVDRISFTKLDEAVSFGSIYNLRMVYGRPVAYLSTGQKVPDDIEFPDETTLGNLILSKGLVRC